MREKGGSEMLEAIQHSEFEEAISSDDALCQEETQFQIERQTYFCSWGDLTSQRRFQITCWSDAQVSFFMWFV